MDLCCFFQTVKGCACALALPLDCLRKTSQLIFRGARAPLSTQKKAPVGRTMERQRQKPPRKKIGQVPRYNTQQLFVCCFPPPRGGIKGRAGGTKARKRIGAIRGITFDSSRWLLTGGTARPASAPAPVGRTTNARYRFGNGASLPQRGLARDCRALLFV